MHYNKDMLRIAQMEEGEKIYHYTTIDALINIVSRKELWVTKWDYLNDMDELTVAEDVCAVVLREENVKSEVIQDVKKYIKESIRGNALSDSYYICSFSHNKDSQLLWSNYSNYDGINIEIDFAKFRENLNHSIMWDGLVNYDFESQKECLKRTFCDEIIGVADFGNIKSLEEINKLQAREYEILISHMSIICELYSMFFKEVVLKGRTNIDLCLLLIKNKKSALETKIV